MELMMNDQRHEEEPGQLRLYGGFGGFGMAGGRHEYLEFSNQIRTFTFQRAFLWRLFVFTLGIRADVQS